jgi:hypothetical protein
MRECRSNVGGRLAAALLVVLLPLLQLSRRPDAPASSHIPHGHEELSLAAFTRLVSALPDGAVVVREDALTDILWRALDGTWQKSGKALRTVDREPAATASLAQSTATFLYALPNAQESLQKMGFTLTAAAPPQVAGVARVEWGGACQVLTSDWRDATGVASFRTLSMVAGDDRSRGTVEIRLAGSAPLDVKQVGWTAYAAPGFSRDTYQSTQPEDRGRLLRDLDDAAAPHDPRLTDASSGLAIVMWRRPGVGRVLTIDLVGTPIYAIARYAPGPAQTLALCPTFPYEVVGFSR